MMFHEYTCHYVIVMLCYNNNTNMLLAILCIIIIILQTYITIFLSPLTKFKINFLLVTIFCFCYVTIFIIVTHIKIY